MKTYPDLATALVWLYMALMVLAGKWLGCEWIGGE